MEITIDKIIYDDTSRGEDYKITDILYQNSDIAVCTVSNNEDDSDIDRHYVMINKKTRSVTSFNNSFDFYYIIKC
jgi:hypothetical protein